MRWLGLRKKRVEMPPVLTMGATNMAESLDAALLRPGRFDRKIIIEEPDSDGRRDIIEYYLGKVKHEPMPMDRMISDTIGFTPVAIKFVINEAAIHAHFEGREFDHLLGFHQGPRNTRAWLEPADPQYGLQRTTPAGLPRGRPCVCNGQAAQERAADQGDDHSPWARAWLCGLEAIRGSRICATSKRC